MRSAPVWVLMSMGRIVRQSVRMAAKGLSHLTPCHAERTSRNIGEFVEPLDTDDAAAIEQILRPCCARIAGESVDQDIAIEEFTGHRTYRALAPSRSNFQSGGSSLRKARICASARSRLLCARDAECPVVCDLDFNLVTLFQP